MVEVEEVEVSVEGNHAGADKVRSVITVISFFNISGEREQIPAVFRAPKVLKKTKK